LCFSNFLIIQTNEINLNIQVFIHKLKELLGGGFGGKPDFAQAGGPNSDKLEEAMGTLKELVKEGIK